MYLTQLGCAEPTPDSPMKTHLIRAATSNDGPQLAHLLTSLGHDTSSERIASMWAIWTEQGNRALVASWPDEQLIGVATLHQMHVLHRPRPVGRITALFVDARARGNGIGRDLVHAAETELRKRGCGLLEITSHSRLIEAHAFYEHLGYRRTSVRLAKDLPEA